jgi:glycosyltransferase involved in cell wall biosynthesis
MKIKISIIIPAYNSELFLARCLDSIVAQTYSYFEVIVVNDGSFDKTQDIADEYASIDMRFIVLNQKNRGVVHARKEGIKLASGDYIFNLDSDDYIESNSLEIFIKRLEKTDDDIIISNHWHHENNRIRKIKNVIPKENTPKDYLTYLLVGKIRGYIWGKLIRRNLLIHNDASSESLFYEDITTNYFIFSTPNVKVSLVEECTVNYFIHGNNTTKKVSSKHNNAFLYHINYIKDVIQQMNLSEELSSELSFCICRHWIDFSRMNKDGLENKQFKKEIYRYHIKNAGSFLNLHLKIELLCYLINHQIGHFFSNTSRIIYGIIVKLKIHEIINSNYKY